MTEVIGWFSSFVLVLTIAKQVHKQWRSGSSEGVSKWLFVGQITASVGFTVYSFLVRNWVFVVTNALLLLSAILGGIIVLKHGRAERRRGVAPSPRPSPRGRGDRGVGGSHIRSGAATPAGGSARPAT